MRFEAYKGPCVLESVLVILISKYLFRNTNSFVMSVFVYFSCEKEQFLPKVGYQLP